MSRQHRTARNINGAILDNYIYAQTQCHIDNRICNKSTFLQKKLITNINKGIRDKNWKLKHSIN